MRNRKSQFVVYNDVSKEPCNPLMHMAMCGCKSILGADFMLNIRDLRIDPASLGRKMLLVDVMPAYEYKDGKRTETVTGYRYVVCLAEHRLEKLSVRIDGPQQMEQPEGYVDVEFTDLVVTGYESQGKLQFSAKASGIFPVE